MFCDFGYYYECVVLPAEEARAYWRDHIAKGWLCQLKKTTKIRGYFVRREVERIIHRDEALEIEARL